MGDGPSWSAEATPTLPGRDDWLARPHVLGRTVGDRLRTRCLLRSHSPGAMLHSCCQRPKADGRGIALALHDRLRDEIFTSLPPPCAYLSVRVAGLWLIGVSLPDRSLAAGTQ